MSKHIESRTVKLGDLLTDEQAKRVEQIVNKAKDSLQLTKGLKEYFATIKDQLEAQGVLPDYLVYVVMARVTGVI